jgi:hypothetical protein
MHRQYNILVGKKRVDERKAQTHKGRIFRILLRKYGVSVRNQIQKALVHKATKFRDTRWQRILMTSSATISSSRSLLHEYKVKIKHDCDEEN